MKTAVVLGAAYGGARAASVLAKSIPEDWRVIVIDRNTHANHLYVVSRFAVLPGHEHKAFIPYHNLFGKESTRHLVLHATIIRLTSHSVTLSRPFPEFGLSDVIEFDYCVYALGSILPAPIDLWGECAESNAPSVDVLGVDEGLENPKRSKGTKAEGMAWLRRSQRRIKDVQNILVVGGGALGIQFASDIKNVYPEKHVTLLHSRSRLLPRFDPLMHNEIMQVLEDLGIDVHLSTRLDLSSLKSKSHIVRTTTGKELASDLLLLCTGQTPNTQLLKGFAPETVDPETSLACVTRALQLSPIRSNEERSEVEPNSVEALLADLGLQEENSANETPYKHIFVVGDAADAFGAIKAGHNAYYQGEVAARNILHLISGEELEEYEPGKPAIKVSLGLRHAVYQSNGLVGTKQDGADDLDAALIWPYFGADVNGPGGMMA